MHCLHTFAISAIMALILTTAVVLGERKTEASSNHPRKRHHQHHRGKVGKEVKGHHHHPRSMSLAKKASDVVPVMSVGCEYEGQLYAPGSRFKPDPCTQCRCPRRGRGGLVQCTVEDCGRDSHCLRTGDDTNRCCPVCVEYGCRHSDGTMYKPGEVIKNEPCVRCYCPLGGGNPICDVTTCPLSQCVDPVKVDGVCCPVCPNGPNCQIGLLTLPIGQSVMIEGAVCKCETFTDWDGQRRTMARCNKG